VLTDMTKYRCPDCFAVFTDKELGRDLFCPSCGDLLYQLDAESMRNEHEFVVICCFSCSKKIRITFPVKSSTFSCPSCRKTNEIQSINSSIGRKVYLIIHQTGNNVSDRKLKRHDLPENIKKSLCVLNLGEDVSWEDIKSKYRKCMSEYHPDKVAHLGIDLRRLAEEKTKTYNDAYNILKKYFE